MICLPFKCGNNGGWNCVPSDAKCDGKNSGGVARGVLLSSNGRKPLVLEQTKIAEKLNYDLLINEKIHFCSQFTAIGYGINAIKNSIKNSSI